ncbi:MAG: hypothetical protein NPIRA04_16230 [Nitrospirales bacterium]|nr:MAG: hypothetical protein NPIRA04_16230 [Nitrospirales bacterium]
MRITKERLLIVLIIATLSVALINRAFPHDPKHVFPGMKSQVVADLIYSVIEADRTLYSRHVVDRMQDTGTVIASENWTHRNALPLPAQMLLMAGKRVENKGLGLEYRLASLWPIYKKNGPISDFERKGLLAVQQHPEKPFSAIVKRGKQQHFQAIYSDKAVSKACVDCHNSHVLSPKRDYRLNDVMGGVIISFRLE